MLGLFSLDEIFSVAVSLDATEEEISSMLFFNAATQKFFRRQLDTGTYLDMAESIGLNPDTWLKQQGAFLEAYRS